VAITLSAPFFYVITTSLKDSGSLFHYPPQWLPIPPYLGNYQKLIFDSGFPRWMANTLFVASAVTTLKIFLDSMAGYALAKLEFRGKRVVFGSCSVCSWSDRGPPRPALVRGEAAGILDTYWG